MARYVPQAPSGIDYVSLQEATELAGEFFHINDVCVLDYRIESFSTEKLGYLADHKLLIIQVRPNEDEACNKTEDDTIADKYCSFFVKVTFPNANDYERLIFQEESVFFDSALPRLMDHFKGEAYAPKCYLVKDRILVLEDLRAQGYKHGDNIFTTNQMRQAIGTIARFHACSMILQEKLGRRPLTSLFPGRFKEKTFIDDNGGLAWKWLAQGIRVAERVADELELDPKYVAIAYRAMLKQMEPVQDENEHNVLSHEDLWSKNILFNADRLSCRLLDFQMVSYTSFAIDVLQLLYLNADKSVRQRLESQLVRLYHSTLKKILTDHGVDSENTMSLELVTRTIEKKRICGLVMAVQIFPISLLNKQFATEFSLDPKLFHHYSYVNRADFVSKVMLLDSSYKQRLQESVRELVEYTRRFQRTHNMS